MEDPSKSINISQKSTQYENIIKEKRKMADKLKIQLIREQKKAQENTRKLQKDNQKEELETHMKKLTE